MGVKEIRGKLDNLIERIDATQEEFEERDVVYILVETYKIKERQLKSARSNIKTAIPCLSFYRDWVVHTHLHDERWYRDKAELNRPERLLEEMFSIIEVQDTRERIRVMWPSFVRALNSVTANQEISSR